MVVTAEKIYARYKVSVFQIFRYFPKISPDFFRFVLFCAFRCQKGLEVSLMSSTHRFIGLPTPCFLFSVPPALTDISLDRLWLGDLPTAVFPLQWVQQHHQPSFPVWFRHLVRGATHVEINRGKWHGIFLLWGFRTSYVAIQDIHTYPCPSKPEILSD